MIFNKTACRIFIGIAVSVCCAASAGALDDDFATAQKAVGKNITVYLLPEIPVGTLITQLNVRPADTIIAGKIIAEVPDSASALADMLDTLYLRVSDIIDMHLYDLHIDIKVCRDQAQLDTLYTSMFNTSLGGRRSFYVYSPNVIYVTTDGFTREIIGHEMTHAIICHYFPVPPPVKVQEILAMYVEYNLRHDDKK